MGPFWRAAFIWSSRIDSGGGLGAGWELGGLPLALEQAAAYITATGRDLAGYLVAYWDRREDRCLHRQVAAIALVAGFALGGGNALLAHGIISRPTQDVDLFTDHGHGKARYS